MYVSIETNNSANVALRYSASNTVIRVTPFLKEGFATLLVRANRLPCMVAPGFSIADSSAVCYQAKEPRRALCFILNLFGRLFFIVDFVVSSRVGIEVESNVG